jgi:uncharacterized protein YdeI (YjbR/CyaY-like superfamily)
MKFRDSTRVREAMTTKKDLPTFHFKSQKEWENWLKKNHAESDGIWIKFAKKAAGIKSISYPEALDVAICYGWIDGQKASFDGEYWLQRFTRRGPRSKWSKINCQKAAEFISRGKMKAPGLLEVETAKKDGRWDAAYESQRAITVPEDLQQKLDENPRALEFFATLDGKNRYAILYRIHDAKKPETRAQRIEKFVAMLNEGKTVH